MFDLHTPAFRAVALRLIVPLPWLTLAARYSNEAESTDDPRRRQYLLRWADRAARLGV